MQKMIGLFTFISICSGFFLLQSSFADEIYLNNGDKVTGTIVEKTSSETRIKTDAMGIITINQSFVKEIVTDQMLFEAKQKEENAKKQPQWTNSFEAGYSQAGGNTKSASTSSKLSMHRKTDGDEFHASIQAHYASNDNRMNTQKFAGLLRYASSFGEEMKWYNFIKLEGDRDRFANIKYRLIPSVGVGYWFADKDDFKAMLEVGLGYQHTNYRDDTKDSNEAILIPRGYWEKKLFDNLTLSQDITLYPSLSEFGEYRLNLITDLIHPINDELSLKFSWSDEYNSNPPTGTKKNDYRITSSVVYSF